MIKTIRKVGDSYGILLPTREVRGKLGVTLGTPMSVDIKDGTIRMTPLIRKPDLDAVMKIVDSLIKRYGVTIDLLAQR